LTRIDGKGHIYRQAGTASGAKENYNHKPLLGGHEAQRQAFQAAQSIVETAFWLAGELNPPHVLRQRLQHDFSLQSGQKLADADVNTGTESDMTQDFAFDIVFVRILPLTRIPIGGPEE
jgi:hypothetical protein